MLPVDKRVRLSYYILSIFFFSTGFCFFEYIVQSVSVQFLNIYVTVITHMYIYYNISNHIYIINTAAAFLPRHFNMRIIIRGSLKIIIEALLRSLSPHLSTPFFFFIVFKISSGRHAWTRLIVRRVYIPIFTSIIKTI